MHPSQVCLYAALLLSGKVGLGEDVHHERTLELMLLHALAEEIVKLVIAVADVFLYQDKTPDAPELDPEIATCAPLP